MAYCAVPCGVNPLRRECEEIHLACKDNTNTGKQKCAAAEGDKTNLLCNVQGRPLQEAGEGASRQQTYYAMYKEDLCKRLEKELHGKLEKAVLLWMHDAAERDAIIARTSLEGWRTDDRALIEVICTRSSTQIVKIREAYQKRYQRCLDDDVFCKTKGPYQKLLLALLKAHRCECKGVDMNKVKCDAMLLYEAGEGHCGTDEETFIRIFSERTVAQLRATFACYQQEYGHDITTALRRETQKEFEEAIRVTITSMYLPAHYFAKELHRAMKGLVNDESAIARVMVTRAEVDLKEINVVYERKYKMSIVQAFHREISGYFKNFCLALTVRAGIRQVSMSHCGCN